MATTKQRHKQELKALNVECEQRLSGKKGPERDAELKVIADLKDQLAEKHKQELLQEAEQVPPPAEEGTGTPAAPKISKARQRELKREAKEAEEKKKRELDAKNRGPTPRDMEMKALETEVTKLGLKIHEIPPDGNCLFSAVAHQVQVLEGKSMSVQDLRTLTCDTMKANPALFEPFLPDGDTLQTYVAKVNTNGEWGGELEVRALSMGLARQIWIHRISTPTVKMGEDERYHQTRTLHLTFHEHQFALGEHYNSAAPNSL